MTSQSPESIGRLQEAARLRTAFVADFAAREVKWSAHNMARLLHATGERPERVNELKAILRALGLGCHGPGGYYTWLDRSGVFDHGEMFARDRLPFLVVGHPYQINDAERAGLASLVQYPTLRVRIDDRPSYYGFGTHHVRIELVEPRPPFTKPPATAKTRAAARAARQAFAESFGPSPIFDAAEHRDE